MTIRRQPSDFRVEERLAGDVLSGVGDGRVWMYRLEKTSLTTMEAAQRLAKALGIKPGLVEHAGLKDKHASTLQHVSARFERPTPDPPGALSGPGWSAARVGPIARPLSAGDIEANAFTIVVRDLSHEASAAMEARAAFLRAEPAGHDLLIVNAFGDQRFGSARHGEGFAAAHLVRGAFEPALKLLIATPARKDSGVRRAFTRLAATHWGDWAKLATELPRCPDRRAVERLAAGGSARDAFAALPYAIQQLCVDAFQSSLWNLAAAGLVRSLAASAGPSSLLTADDPFGTIVFPAPELVPDPWRGLEVPMPSPGVTARQPWGEPMVGALAEHGLTFEQLRIPGLRRPEFGAFARPLFVRASRFELSASEPDELSPKGRRLKRTVRFELPRGAYATVVLRGLGQ
jgi:tRNA pseudouridine13 synthase